MSVTEHTAFGDCWRLGATRYADVRLIWPEQRAFGRLPVRDRPAAALAHELWTNVVAAVARTIGDAPEVVVSLSGGLDSVALAIAAVEVVGPARVRGVTAGYLSDFEDPEPALAQDVAKYLGIAWDLVAYDTAKLIHRWPRDSWHPSPPQSRPELQWEQLMPAAGAVISGLGGDSLQRGDRDHYRERVRTSGWARAAADVWLAAVYGVKPGFGTSQWLRRAHRITLPSWIRDDAPGLREVVKLRQDLPKTWRRGIDELMSPVWGDMFSTVDSRNTGTSYDYVYPFFDEELARFWATIPTIPWAVGKQALRAALRGRCPEHIRLRPKTLLMGEPLVEITKSCLSQLHEALDTDAADRWFDAREVARSLSVGVHRYYDVHDAVRCASVARWLDAM